MVTLRRAQAEFLRRGFDVERKSASWRVREPEAVIRHGEIHGNDCVAGKYGVGAASSGPDVVEELVFRPTLRSLP